jgi:hypothetical protein
MARINGIGIVSLRRRVEGVMPLRCKLVPSFDLHCYQPCSRGAVWRMEIIMHMQSRLTLMMSFGNGVLSGLSLKPCQYNTAGAHHRSLPSIADYIIRRHILDGSVARQYCCRGMKMRCAYPSYVCRVVSMEESEAGKRGALYRNSDTLEMPLCYAVDMKLGKDGVSRGASSKQYGSANRELHCVSRCLIDQRGIAQWRIYKLAWCLLPSAIPIEHGGLAA